ncbi:hypothetical protein Dimus_024592 [Dionaea muscipula]
MVFEAFGVPLVDKKGEKPKKYDFFEDTFLTMCKLTRENGIWWIGSGENRRRDDADAPEVEEEDEDEGNKDDFDWEAVIDEATVEGESGSEERFYDAEDETQGSPEIQEEIPAAAPQSSAHRSGENRRRDDADAPEVEEEEEDEGNKDDFDWEAVIDEATVEGESGSEERFYDAEDETQGSPEIQEEIPAAAPQSSAQQ